MPRRKRRVASRVREYLRNFVAFLFSNIGVVVLVVVYTIAGAFMFQAIEGAGEMDRLSQMERERDNTAQYLWQNVTLTFNPLNESAMKNRISKELSRYQSRVVVAVRRGWDGGRSSRQWSFSSAFLYSLTVITTIGYGHLSPRTSWGKVMTIFYALLGMPLFLLYLTNVGELLARWCKCLYALMCLCRGCPGFSRRRIIRLRNQLEISDAESIERPEHWRNYPHWNAGDYRYSDNRNPDSRYPEYRNSYDCSDRDRNLRYPGHRYPEYRDSDFRNPEFRDLDFRSPDYGHDGHRGHDCSNRARAPPRFPPQRGLRIRVPLDRIPESASMDHLDERFPNAYQECRNQQYTSFQKRPEYLRSASMPHPRTKPSPRALQRGWSVPARLPDEGSSDFSYVTFDAQTITVPISVCVAIMVGYLIFGSMIFGLWEKWDQLDGAYFCFISLSSIGFGDFVPGERVYTPRIETSFIVCSMYLMLGMALVAMCFNLMQEQVIHYVAGMKRAVIRICRCRCKR